MYGQGGMGGGGMGGGGMGGGGMGGGGGGGGGGRRMDEVTEGKLFLGGLDQNVTTDQLVEYCSSWCGPPRCARTGQRHAGVSRNAASASEERSGRVRRLRTLEARAASHTRRTCRGQVADTYTSPKGFGFVTFSSVQDAFNFLEVGPIAREI